MIRIISREDLLSWLGRLLEQSTLIAPVESNGLLLFKPVTRVAEIVLDFENTALSPKAWFFPTSENLFMAPSKEGETELMPAGEVPEVLLFGLHPCDARGIALMDKPFLAEPADTLYQEHRAKTTLIGLSCQKPGPECFCTSLGGAPDDPSHLDILLTEMESGYAVQTTTEKGEALLAGVSMQQSAAPPPPPPSLPAVPVEGIEEVVRGTFEFPYWGRLSDRCLHCNVCAYVCPTCYCFDIRDYTEGGRVERVRTWESCQSPGFTHIAGGYDPRSSKGVRLRQRFCHKLLYFPEDFGPIACVGCGRCVRSCPVNIDIREVIADIQKLGAPSEG